MHEAWLLAERNDVIFDTIWCSHLLFSCLYSQIEYNYFFLMLTSFSLDQILDMGLKRNFVPVTLCAQGMILFQETYN